MSASPGESDLKCGEWFISFDRDANAINHKKPGGHTASQRKVSGEERLYRNHIVKLTEEDPSTERSSSSEELAFAAKPWSVEPSTVASSPPPASPYDDTATATVALGNTHGYGEEEYDAEVES